MRKTLITIFLCMSLAAYPSDGGNRKPEVVYRIAWAQGFMACMQILRQEGYAPAKSTDVHKMYKERFAEDSLWFRNEYLKK